MKLLSSDAIFATGVANNWTTLNRRIAKEGFPPGRIIGRCRYWTEAEVAAWVESRPSTKIPPKGACTPDGVAKMAAKRAAKKQAEQVDLEDAIAEAAA